MWTVFFKVDGTTCVFSEQAVITGKATLKTSPGNHGNLVGGGGMDAGDVITIPTAIGRWKTVMVPVPSVESKPLQVGGALGVVVVVLEEDETPHAAAAAGHKAFNEAMQRELDALTGGRLTAKKFMPKLKLGPSAPPKRSRRRIPISTGRSRTNPMFRARRARIRPTEVCSPESRRRAARRTIPRERGLRPAGPALRLCTPRWVMKTCSPAPIRAIAWWAAGALLTMERMTGIEPA